MHPKDQDKETAAMEKEKTAGEKNISEKEAELYDRQV